MTGTDGASPRDAVLAVRSEVAKVVVGQEGTLSGLVAALLVRGHVLLEGVPGVAKTLLVKAVAAALDLDFRRVQFTPDLMPSDVIGQTIYSPAEGTFSFREGPVFTNLLLADEINRTPPKTQAALLEAMEERQVSVEGDHARRCPIRSSSSPRRTRSSTRAPTRCPRRSSTASCSSSHVGYPTRRAGTGGARPPRRRPRSPRRRAPRACARSPAPPTSPRRGPQVDGVRVEPPVLAYIVVAGRATRESPSLTLGVSPRGATTLLHAAKAWAWLAGRDVRDARRGEGGGRADAAPPHPAARPSSSSKGATADGVLDGILATGARRLDDAAMTRAASPRGDSPPWPRCSRPSCWRCPATAGSGLCWWSTLSCCRRGRRLGARTRAAADRGRADGARRALTRSSKARCVGGREPDRPPRPRRVRRRARAVAARRGPPRAGTHPVTGPGDHAHHDPSLAARPVRDPRRSSCASTGRSGWPRGSGRAPMPAVLRVLPAVPEPRTRPSCGSTAPASSRSGCGRRRAAAGAPSSTSCASTRPTTSSGASTGRRPPAPASPSSAPTAPSATRPWSLLLDNGRVMAGRVDGRAPGRARDGRGDDADGGAPPGSVTGPGCVAFDRTVRAGRAAVGRPCAARSRDRRDVRPRRAAGGERLPRARSPRRWPASGAARCS